MKEVVKTLSSLARARRRSVGGGRETTRLKMGFHRRAMTLARNVSEGKITMDVRTHTGEGCR